MAYRILNIAVCDDSSIDRDILTDLLYDYFDRKDLVCKVFQYSSGNELLKEKVASFDLIFLDLIMPDINGIELANKILEINKDAKFIFCSSSTEYVEDSYYLKALHYFIKPININKFNIILDKFIESHTSLQTVEIKVGRMNETYFLSSILWIEPYGHHTFVYTTQGVVESSEAFSDIVDRFEQYDFVKASRFAFVSLKHIKKVEANYLTLDDNTNIPFSRTCKDDALKKYNKYRLLNQK